MITFLCSDINAHGGAQNRELVAIVTVLLHLLLPTTKYEKKKSVLSVQPNKYSLAISSRLDRHMPHWLFYKEFNDQQILFETLFNIIGNFDSVKP